MTTQLTPSILRRTMPNCSSAKLAEYLPFINQAINEFDIGENYLRKAAFLAQLAHESAELRYMEEIASGAAYEGITALGNTHAGDGKRYKGRGPIQLTGRANYKKYGGLLGLDLINDPKAAATKEVGFRIAGLFWKLNGLNELADKEKFKAITKRINGGYNGQADREAYYEKALHALKGTDSTDVAATVDTPLPVVEETDKGVTTGTKPAEETAGTPPPVPAAEIQPSQPSLFTKIGSLSIPAGVMTVLGAIGKFVQGLPAWAWVAMLAMALLVGYLIWRDAQKRAHERTLKIMDAAADKDKNNLRII